MGRFEEALAVVLEKEGGYACHPADRGSETYRGIARRYHPDWPGWRTVDEVKASSDSAVRPRYFPATDEQHRVLTVEVRHFYHEQFWNHLYEKLPQVIATKILDLTVHLGKPRGIQLLQEALNDEGAGITVDGVFGPQTLQAARLTPAGQLLIALRAKQVEYYVGRVLDDPSQRVFLKGWIRRAVAALVVCLWLFPLTLDLSSLTSPAHAFLLQDGTLTFAVQERVCSDRATYVLLDARQASGQGYTEFLVDVVDREGEYRGQVWVWFQPVDGVLHVVDGSVFLPVRACEQA